VAQAEAIIDAGVQSFAHWLDQRAAVPLIQALNRQADDWGAAELGRARKLLARGEPVENVLEAMARGLTHKMLHGTLAELHAAEGDERARLADTVSRLFLRQSARQPGRGGDSSDSGALAPVLPTAAARNRRAPHWPFPMNPSLREQFERLALRLAELDATLADPQVSSDIKRYRSLSREQAEVRGMVERFRRYQQREARPGRRAGHAGRPRDGRDGAEEIASASADMARLHAELQTALIPRDPDDERNAFLEIRAGTGGDESALFAGDLARMYLRWFERQGWRTEILSQSDSELGGYKELVLRMEGERVYEQLRFESGGHRVQRVPATESQGRIHTSACTVAVMPEPDEAEEVQLNPADLRIDTFRASGAGGQHINKTDSAIRITHLPTGLVAECQDDRSQHRNKAKAMAVLAARLRDKDKNERAAKEAATRKGLIGSGDRSDRIRTYNFPQGRLTDHRINLTLYKLGQIMEGDLADVWRIAGRTGGGAAGAAGVRWRLSLAFGLPMRWHKPGAAASSDWTRSGS
jgi:peptide chain release factor 1